MSAASIKIPKDATIWIDSLFNLEYPITTSQSLFEEYWPLISSVYTKLGGKLIQQNGTVEVQKYECRLRKSKKTGKAPPPKTIGNGGIKKRHGRTGREKGQCNVRIKTTRTLEAFPPTVTIERLDENKHSHTIEQSRKIAPSELAVQIAEQEATKGYAPAQVLNEFPGPGGLEGETLIEQIGGAHVDRNHIQYTVQIQDLPCRIDERILLRTTTFREDVEAAIKLLGEKTWLHQEFHVLDSKGEMRWGLVFAHTERVQWLKRRGHLTQFDATHKTNAWGHNLFSFLVRSEENIWIPAGHCVVERENSETLSYALKMIKQWCGWQPRYVLTNDSAMEQLAVRNAFPGLIAGEQEVTHLLCTMHSMRTLNKRFKAAEYQGIFNKLRQAMYTSMRSKCLELCKEAITAAFDIGMKNYIHSYWLESSEKWALYARNHSPLLLQVQSTNACGAWHRKLKGGSGIKNGGASKHGIYGMVLNIMQQAEDIDQRATKAHNEFRANHLSIATRDYPEIGQFPVPIQKLIANEVEAVAEQIAGGKETHEFDENLTCNCLFSRKYLLPCRHIFHLDGEVKILTSDKWQKYLSMFEGSGFEVYETIGHVFVEEEQIQSVDTIRTRSVLQLRKLEEGLRQQLYAVHEIMEENITAVSEHQETIENWMSHVCETIAPLTDILPEEIVKKHGRPWEL